jgi:hypothetical protein
MYTQVFSDGKPMWDDEASAEWRSNTLSVYVIFEGSSTLQVRAYPNRLVEQNRIESFLWRVQRQRRRWFP